MIGKFDELNESGANLLYLRVSAEGQVQRAVAYLRVAAEGLEGIAALVEQENILQQFADHNGYRVADWYVEGKGVEKEENALSRLLADVVSEGCEFNAVLVWNYSRLSRNVRRLSEILDVFRTHGVELVSVADHMRLADLERQLAKLTRDPDDEVAG